MTSPPIAPVSSQDYLLARLAAVSDARRSPRQLAQDLRSRLPSARWLSAMDKLSASGWILPGAGKVTLTPAGRQEVTRRHGQLTRNPQHMARRVEPALCLGYRPDSPAAARIVHGDALRAVLLTRLYGLPLEESKVTLQQAIGSLLLRGMVGLAAQPPLGQVSDAARRISTELSDIDRLRHTLLTLALAYGCAEERPTRVAEASPRLRQFAQHVANIAQTAHRGPFAHKTPVDHIYDEYGRRHADAGTLAEFKQRLLQASHAGLLALLPLDDPKALDEIARERSAIAVPGGALHFVERAP